MIIGSDIDETLLSFMGPLIRFLREEKGIIVPDLGSTHTFDLDKVWGCTREEAFSRVHDFYNSSDFLKLQAVPYASDAVYRMSRHHSIYGITSRTKEISLATLTQLESNFPGCFENVFHTSQYSMAALNGVATLTKGDLCKRLGVEIFVEDAIHHAEQIASPETRVLLLPQPWNAGRSVPEGVVRVADWNEVERYVENYKNGDA